ncbi:hypothetical protein [Variovorax saccharolyticus]|uniref:hypothetical protein n=1 Tax=Variovorax saccharolyticus TaxID=3053516 RepID=UPI0025784C27|nr:hypothetical protein [Variovorax sp. J22R187]MDM0020531.1 hypothetical protein [Variovorax sp. J22R187]
MRADRPLADFQIQQLNVNATFAINDKRWDPDLLSLSILPEFLAVGPAGAEDWKAVAGALPNPDANNSPAVMTEIDRLRVLAVTERPEALGEILEQDQNFQLELLHLLMINGASHPQTYLLMKLAARVGELMMVHLKRQFNRARPSQICPTLYPPVGVPGHSAYPAGHALIARLTALCLKEVVPQEVHDSLDELVRRISVNRLIAGLHFATDNAAGVQAANLIFPILRQCPLYQNTRAAALNE